MAANLPPPVALPPVNNIIQLPPQPQNPPVAADIAASQRYKRDAIAAHGNHSISDTVLADALTYDLKLLQARDVAAVPAWFNQAMQQQLAPINQKLDGITQRLDDLTTVTDRVLRLSAISYNKQVGTGSARPFEIVPFLDGSNPTHEPHNLPPLSNLTAVNNLNAAQSRSYYRGYHGPHGNLPAVQRRKQIILRDIGYEV